MQFTNKTLAEIERFYIALSQVAVKLMPVFQSAFVALGQGVNPTFLRYRKNLNQTKIRKRKHRRRRRHKNS